MAEGPSFGSAGWQAPKDGSTLKTFWGEPSESGTPERSRWRRRTASPHQVGHHVVQFLPLHRVELHQGLVQEQLGIGVRGVRNAERLGEVVRAEDLVEVVVFESGAAEGGKYFGRDVPPVHASCV